MPEDNNAQGHGQFKPNPFKTFVRKQASNCRIGYGAVLSLEFSEKSRGDDLPEGSGKWSVWSDQILWRIEENGHVLAGSEDDRERMQEAVRQVGGRALVAGEIDGDSGDAVLTFSGGLMLRTFVIKEDGPLWHISQDDSTSAMPGRAAEKQEAEQ